MGIHLEHGTATRVTRRPIREKKTLSTEYQLIAVPERLHKVIIRIEYLAVCNGNPCAAALLNAFERLTAWKRANGQRDWIDWDATEWREKLLNAFTVSAIKRALKEMREAGLLVTAPAGSHKYDRKLKYALAIDVVQDVVNAVLSPDEVTDSDTSIGEISTMDRTKSNASIVQNPPMHWSKTIVSTLEDQVSTDQESFKQESSDQTAATGRAAAAADRHATIQREKRDFQSVFQGLSARAHLLTTPPSSALPPLHEAAVRTYEANIGKAGDAVRAEICAAVEQHGEALVIEKIELAAKRGARSWAYVAKMLPVQPHEPMTGWNDAADNTPSGADLTSQVTADSWLTVAMREQAERRAAMTAEERIWDDTYRQLELQLERPTFETWLKSAHLLRVEGQTYVIGVDNVYARDLLSVRLNRTLLRTLREYAGQEAQIGVEVVAKREAS